MKTLALAVILCVPCFANTIYWQDYSSQGPGWKGYGLAGTLNGSALIPAMSGTLVGVNGQIPGAMTLSVSGLDFKLVFNMAGTFTGGSSLVITLASFGPGGVTNFASSLGPVNITSFAQTSERVYINLSGVSFKSGDWISFTTPQVPVIPEPTTLLMVGTGLVGIARKMLA